MKEEFKELEEFFKYGAKMIPDWAIIFCTDAGSIIFTNHDRKSYAMKFDPVMVLMQYCTEHQNKWTNHIKWITEDYWKTIQNSYDLI